MPVPRLSELVYDFKRECESRGWEASQHEDWIKVGDEYHNFLWTRTVHPTTFKKIAEEHRCAILQGISYRVVDVNYTAWLFSETLPEELMQMMEENPALFRKTAIYDLSCMHAEKSACLKLNKTDSQVFQEFESFLEKTWGIKFKSVKDLLSQQV